MVKAEEIIVGKILIVDEQEENLIAMKNILQSLNAEVFTANTADVALSLLAEHNFALVLVDIHSPDTGGFELAFIMNQSDKLKQIPVIFISTVSKEQDYVVAGYENGVVDYIFKPLEPAIVRNKVKLFLELDAQREKLERLHKQTKQLLYQLTTTERQNKQLLDSASEGILGFEQSGVISFVNKQSLRLLQQSEENILGCSIQKYLTPPDISPGPLWESSPIYKAMHDNREYRISSGFIWRDNGSNFPVDYGCSPIINDSGNCTGGVMTFQDITVRKLAEEQLIHIAQFDDLTDLANRDLFTTTLSKSLLHAQRNSRCCAVLFLDLDNFKKINDTMGHSAGDELLISISRRLKGALREDDLPARFGGDEFAVLLNDLARNEDAFKVADTILKSMREPHLLLGEEVVVSFSIGIATYPDSGSDTTLLMKAADMAMYHAKQKGKNNFQFFSDHMQKEAERRFVIEAELKTALPNNEFTLVYQPQIETSTGKVVGVEALIRWHNPTLGEVSPSEFIPVAEEAGLVSEISSWVIECVFEQHLTWKATGHHFSNITLAVNLSLKQFTQALQEVYQRSMEINEGNAAHPVGIDIEISEMSLQDNLQRDGFKAHDVQSHQSSIEAIHKMGFKIIIDDFGKGGMSLSSLMRLPVDVLKIHNSIIADIGTDEFAETIVRYTISFAHEMGFKVIAEGVERMEQVVFLKQCDCDFLQGFLFCEPVELAELEKLPEIISLD